MATQSKFFADLGIKSATHTEVDGNLTIAGNLTVQGTQTTIDSTTKSVADSMIELASGNTSSDIKDIGIYGNYDDGLSDGGASEYTGLFRDASDSTWKFYDGLEVEPTTTVNTSGTGYTLADLQVGDLTATTLTATNGLTGSSITYPTSDGTSGQVIKTNGSGTLSFGNATLDSLSDCTISSATPSATTNPPYAGAMWIEEDTGDVYVCTNATTNNNTWVKTGSADGITASGSNTIIQSPDDTSVAYINNTGYFGINHDNPAGRLHVAGHTSSIASIFESNGNGDTVPLQLKVKANNGTTSTQGLYGNAGSTSTDNTITLGSSSTSGLTVTNGGNVGINETSPEFSGFGSNGGGLELDDVGSSFTAVKVSQGSTGNLYLAASTGAGYLWQHSNSPMIFGTNNAERIRIEESGDIRFGISNAGLTAGEVYTFDNQMKGNTIALRTQGGTGMFSIDMLNTTGGTCKQVQFRAGGSAAVTGSITSTGNNATQYNTSSDYRLKENVDYTWDATTKLKQLKPARFNWITDDSNTLVDGFLAHEVSSIVPEAITGAKDAVDSEGNPDYQGIDQSKLVPLLVKTIQELEARITTLES